MSRLIALVLSLCLAFTSIAADYYVHARTGSSGNTGLTSGSPKQTIAQILAAGFGTAAGDRLFMAGTFREQLRMSWQAGHVCSGLWIGQWPGQEQAVLRGDTPTTLASWNVTATAGVFDLTIAAGTCAWWNDSGTHRTLTEGIVSVTVDWDRSIDAYGRHFGHLKQSSTSVAASMVNNTWAFIPATPAGSGGGGGTLRICLTDYANDAALDASGLQINYVLGNRNGIEIGTPTYTTYPTWGAYDGRNVTNCTIDGLHVYLWCDSGYRQNKPVSNGQGDDSSAYGAGNVRGTVSIGYGIRPADWTGGLIQNCTLIDNGYHAAMYVGDHCTNNVFRNIVAWGGGVNPFSGGSTGAFYTGPGAGYDNNNNIKGCVAERYIAYRYTLLGRDGACVPHPLTGTDAGTVGDTYCSYDGMLIHTNARSGSVSSTSTAAAAVITTSAAHSMFTGELVTIEAHTGSSTINGTWPITVLSTTTFSIPVQGVAGTATYFSASNVVEDVEFRECWDIQHGNLTAHTTCPGSPYIGGARSKRASDPTNWRTYPIRHIDIVTVNSATNLVSNETDMSFFRGRFDLARAGVDSGGPAMGSNSGYQNQNFTSCEIVANLGHSTGTREVFKLNFSDKPNKIYLIGTSLYNTGERGTVSTQWFFTLQNDTTGVLTSAIADRVYARQSVFAHKWCNSTTASGEANRGLMSNAVAWSSYNGGTDPAVPINIRDCMYANIGDNLYISYSGGAISYGGETNYTTYIDPNGVYMGQDPTIANIALGYGQRMPYADPAGTTLELTGAARARTKLVWPNCDFGFNTSVGDGSPLKYSNNYGAWQYGPSQSTYRRVMTGRVR